MHVVVMGCGRVGSRLAHDVERLGHSVAVVDRDPAAFRRLGADFTGEQVAGVGFDRDTLHAARITDATAFAAVSSGDNSNILAARVASETFGVERVVARIYDPARAAVYQRLGIPTVATVPWTSDQILRRILPPGPPAAWTDPSGSLVLVELGVGDAWSGRPVQRLEEAAGVRVAYLVRHGSPVLPRAGETLLAGDGVHALAPAGASGRAAAVAAAAPGA